MNPTGIADLFIVNLIADPSFQPSVIQVIYVVGSIVTSVGFVAAMVSTSAFWAILHRYIPHTRGMDSNTKLRTALALITLFSIIWPVFYVLVWILKDDDWRGPWGTT